MTNHEAENILHTMASLIEFRGLPDRCIQSFREAYEMAMKSLKNEDQQGEWEDYSINFYKCPECGYLLNKDCPQCQNKVVLPRGDAR